MGSRNIKTLGCQYLELLTLLPLVKLGGSVVLGCLVGISVATTEPVVVGFGEGPSTEPVLVGLGEGPSSSTLMRVGSSVLQLFTCR